MKIYKPEPDYVIRLQIIKQTEETKYLSLTDCTMEEVEEYVKTVIMNEHISPFAEGRKVMVNIREATGAKNGKSKNISFRGLTTQRVYDLLSKNINHKF